MIGCKQYVTCSVFSNWITSVFQSCLVFPPSDPGHHRCLPAEDGTSSCSSVQGQVEGHGSHTVECLESLHRFLLRGTPPVTVVQRPKYGAPDYSTLFKSLLLIKQHSFSGYTVSRNSNSLGFVEQVY